MATPRLLTLATCMLCLCALPGCLERKPIPLDAGGRAQPAAAASRPVKDAQQPAAVAAPAPEPEPLEIEHAAPPPPDEGATPEPQPVEQDLSMDAPAKPGGTPAVPKAPKAKGPQPTPPSVVPQPAAPAQPAPSAQPAPPAVPAEVAQPATQPVPSTPETAAVAPQPPVTQPPMLPDVHAVGPTQPAPEAPLPQPVKQPVQQSIQQPVQPAVQSAAQPATQAKTQPKAVAGSAYYVQTGAYGAEKNAEGALAELKNKGYASARLVRKEHAAGVFFRVQAGPFPDQAAARKALEDLRTAWPEAFILGD